MGQGGTIVIVNGTDRVWKRTDQDAYQMTFDAPLEIAANSTASFYIEFYQNIFSTWSDDVAHVQYQLVGESNKSVRIEARWGSERYVQYQCIGFNEIHDDFRNLGFNHDGYVTVVLVGGPSTGGYFSNVDTPNAAADWMAGSLSQIGGLRLRDVCLPASHDAGMSLPINGSTFGVGPGLVITQTKNIGEQLGLGSRYFDIRPVTHSGAFYCGHYTDNRGGNGQSIADVIAQINAFTAVSGRNELIVLSVSHDIDTDGTYQDFTDSQWAALYKQLQGLKHLYIASADTDLGSLPIASYIRFTSAVVVVSQGNHTPAALLGKGFYNSASLKVYDDYADTYVLSEMMDNQLSKMKAQTNPSHLFLLSWTLTLSASAVVWHGETTYSLAKQADGALGKVVPEVVPGKAFPNILLIDDFKDTTATTIAIWCNLRAAKTMPTVLTLSSAPCC